jgi:cytochrome c oxidase cbb3-type subunit 3
METNTPEASGADQENEQPIKGHQYDGIQEFDNPMPGWWIWLYVGTFVFAVFYVLGIQVFGYINTYDKDLEESLESLEMQRTEYAAAQPAFAVDEATLARFVNDPSKVTAGAEHFAAQCAACHGAEGQGLIGPNLTDAYWIRGGSNTDVFTVITKGSLEKGMPPWEGMFTQEQRAEMVAYIRSLEGTDPPNAKAPEGEPSGE